MATRALPLVALALAAQLMSVEAFSQNDNSDFDGEANYGFVAPSTCGGVLSLPAYEWQNGCACAGC